MNAAQCSNPTNQYRGAHLDHFGHSVRELAGGEGFEERGIYKDVLRLPECADQIFAVGGVDRGFASDTGIDHGQQGGRYLNEFNTSHTIRWLGDAYSW